MNDTSIALPEGVEDAEVNLAQLAQILNVSTTTVQHWAKDPDCPMLERGTSGKPYRFQLSAVWAWRQEVAQRSAVQQERAARAEQQMRLAIVGDQSGQDLTLSAKERKEEIEVARAYMALGRERRLYISTASVVSGVEVLLSTFRELVDTLPDRLEAEAGLSPKQVEAAQRVTDRFLDECERTVRTADFLRPEDLDEAS